VRLRHAAGVCVCPFRGASPHDIGAGFHVVYLFFNRRGLSVSDFEVVSRRRGDYLGALWQAERRTEVS